MSGSRAFRSAAWIVAVLLLLSACSSPRLTAEGSADPATGGPPSAAETVGESLPSSASEQQKRSSPSDTVLDVLVIGNSFTTGWPDELCGMLREIGVKVNFYSAYHGGSALKDHWNWLRGDKAEYKLRHFTHTGGASAEGPVTLDYCLSKADWDVISIQEAFIPVAKENFDEASFRQNAAELASDLYEYLRSRCPDATFLWHQTWAVEVGCIRKNTAVRTQADQDEMYRIIREVGDQVAPANGARLIPTGTAFQLARAAGSGDLSRGDGCHDGAESGGQYLNACVWFECLTGESCVGSTFRPRKYSLSEEKVALLQQAAHRAVEEYANGSAG